MIGILLYTKKMKIILQIIVSLLFIASCSADYKCYSTNEEQQFFDYEMMFNTYNLNPNEIESKMGKDIIYLLPTINGEPLDVHLRIEKGKDNCCAVFFFQGDPMKVDCDYQRLVKQERINPKDPNVKPHKTTYKEQIDILRFLAFICETKIGVKDFAHLLFGFEDLGELNVDITELCDSVKKVKPDEESGIFPLAMEKTTLAKDLRSIFELYDVEFIDYIWYNKKKIPYNQYATQHEFRKKHNTSYVYLIDGFIVRLNKKQ